MLVCALSFDSQLSCVFFYLLNVFQLKCFPFFLFCWWHHQFSQPFWTITTWNQPARLPHIPCRPCKALGTSQTNLLCSRKNQQHEPSHQWTCCSPQKQIVCVSVKMCECEWRCVNVGEDVSDWRLEILRKNFFNPGLDWRLKIEVIYLIFWIVWCVKIYDVWRSMMCLSIYEHLWCVWAKNCQ